MKVRKIVAIVTALSMCVPAIPFMENSAFYATTVQAQENVYEIYTEEDLLKMAEYPSAEYVLMNDIELSGTDSCIVREFSGTLNGNGHTISNIKYTLFGTLAKKSAVRNLVMDAELTGTGVILASNVYGMVDSCVTQGSIVNTGETAYNIGSFANYNYGIIKNCTNKADITQVVDSGAYKSVAGFVASNYGAIIDSVNSGNISSSASYTGGIAGGYYISYTRTNGVIINCKNTGNISSSYDNLNLGCVGGIKADNESLIYGCVNEGMVSADFNIACGGICGKTTGYSDVIACKNTASVRYGICGEAKIATGTFDENDNFIVNHGDIVIADCVNDVNLEGADITQSYICGYAGTDNGNIFFTRNDNIVNGSLDSNLVDIRQGVWDDESGSMLVDDRIILENNNGGKQLAITVGTPVYVQEGSSVTFEKEIADGVVGVLVDNYMLGYLATTYSESELITIDGYDAQAAGRGNAYFVYDDGKVVVCPIYVSHTYNRGENCCTHCMQSRSAGEVADDSITLDKQNHILEGAYADMDYQTLCQRFYDDVTLLDSDGNQIQDMSGKVKTGDTVRFYDSETNQQTEYEVVVKGDTDGDGVVSVLDMEMIQKDILGLDKLTGAYRNAALLVSENSVSVLDMEMIQKDILGLASVGVEIITDYGW